MYQESNDANVEESINQEPNNHINNEGSMEPRRNPPRAAKFDANQKLSNFR